MEDIKRKILYFGITFVISFTLGILFDHYVLYKGSSVESPEVKGEKEQVEIIVESEETNSQTTSQEPELISPKIPSQEQGCTMYVDVSD